MWDLKYDTNELIYRAETVDIQKSLVVIKRKGRLGRDGLAIFN